ASDALRSVIVVLIPVLYLGTRNTAPVFALVFALFTCNVLFLPAKSALTPEIVPPAQLLVANGLLSIAGVVATAAGALSGGWLIDHWGWQTALYLNGATYGVSVIALLLISYHPHRAAAPPPGISWRRYLVEVTEGWGVVRRNPAVGIALLSLGAVWVGGGFLHVAGN
ncbi:MAG: MFS transporter, partial [Candidatus Eisenbacteria bacterium]